MAIFWYRGSILFAFYKWLVVFWVTFFFTLADDRSCAVGMYVMVIGAYIAAESKDNYPAIKVPYSSLVTPQVCPCLLVFLFPTAYRGLEVLSTKNWRFFFCDLCSLILLQTSF